MTFVPPSGAKRIVGDAFGTWLGELPVAAADRPVLTHDGAVVSHRARVVPIAMVKGDLQQCADMAIRLRAEWLREQQKEVMFHATSGDPLPWKKYLGGERPYEKNGRIAWKPTSGAGDWEGYLRAVFMWAGTRSLVAYDSESTKEVRPGNIVVVPGSPGHAIVLLDVAQRGDEVFVLVGEGYMPAQDFHVELGPVDGWWLWDEGVELDHWNMPASGLRAFK
ncbi:MAG: hypothetical protein HN348_09250 [Proteobacteria bacterium]|nr:hypothetical protein [Pseudomonadota bacterium]